MQVSRLGEAPLQGGRGRFADRHGGRGEAGTERRGCPGRNADVLSQAGLPGRRLVAVLLPGEHALQRTVDGLRNITFDGHGVRHDGRWLVSRDTIAGHLTQAGVEVTLA